MFSELIKRLMGKWWRVKVPSLREGLHFEYHDVIIGTEWVRAIKIIDGPYKGVIYYYDTVKLIPQEQGGPVLRFDYRIYDADSSVEKTVLTSKEFQSFIGDVLTAIICDEKGEYATTREHDSQEPHL